MRGSSRTRRSVRILAIPCLVAAFSAVAPSCSGPPGPEVVVYVSLDELYSRPILDAFERDTGIHVRAQFDTEAAKTIGLVNRLVAEKDRPRADVFWNNEAAQSVRLRQEDIIEPYVSPNAATIPAQYKDPDGYWTGFAARARVIIYNTDLVGEPPRSIRDFAKPEWKGRVAMANPLFGTTATHAAALFALWGEEEAEAFFSALKTNEVAVLPGNATVRDLVARGEFAAGLTDTDDANGAVEDGFPVKWFVCDTDPGGTGALIVPNTLMLVKGGPNPDAGRALIDYLLRPEVEELLARSRSIQIPLHADASVKESIPAIVGLPTMNVSFDAVARMLPVSAASIQEEFLE